MNDKERLRTEVVQVLTRVVESGDPAVIVSPEAGRAAADLLALAQETAEGVPAIDIVDGYVLGHFYWYRSLVTPPTEAVEDLEHAKVFFRGLMAAAPELVPDELRDELFEDAPQRRNLEVLTLGKRASDLYEQARSNRDLTALDESILLTKRLVALDLSDDLATHFHAGLSDQLRDRYEWTGDVDYLASAIVAARRAVDAGASTGTDYWGRLDSLVTRRAGVSGQLPHWDEVVAVRGARLDTASNEMRGRATLRLAAAMLDRHERSLDRVDLRSVADLLCPMDFDSAVLVDRFVLLQTCYLRDNSVMDLSELIAAGWAAVRQLPTENRNAPAVRVNLAYFCLHRYEASGHSGDLADALELAHEGVNAMARDDERLLTAQRTLANVLVRRHELAVRTDTVHGYRSASSNLDDALHLLRQCVDQTPAGAPERAARLADIGAAYLRGAKVDHRPDMLDDAIEMYRQAMMASVVGTEGYSHHVRKLAHSLQQRYLAQRRVADLDWAIDLAEHALAAAPPDPYTQLQARLSLAEAYATRLIDHPDRDHDRQFAMRTYREVSYTDSAGLGAQVSAARSWGRILQEAGRHDEALEGYDRMLHLLSDVAPVSLGEADRIRHVEKWEGASGIAVSCAIAAGRPEYAIELLERARLLTAPAVGVAAADMENLRRRSPDLANQLNALHRAVAADALGQDVTFLPLGIVLVPEQLSTVRRRLESASDSWHATVRQIREVPGLDRFLMPASFEDLRRAADYGPVAMPLSSPDRCDVLLLTSAGADVLPLAVTEYEVVAMANQYSEVLSDIAGASGGVAQRASLEDRLADILAWLWRSTVWPTLQALGYTDPVDGPRAPHVWWSPGGVFSLFPLHAAGHVPDDGAIDRVRSSYAPSLRLLAHLNTEATVPNAATAPLRMVAVGLSDTPGLTHSALPDVERELDAASRAFPVDRRTVLRDADATVAAVRAALPQHDWLHFACHGQQYPRNPLSSRLYLHDGHLSVSDMRWAELRHSRLAILSACETAMTGGTLMDEGLHLSAAIHVAGCPQVVGTLWSVGDKSGAQIVEYLYRHLTQDGEPDTSEVATALHLAVRELRAEAPDLCSSWAPFVHLGVGR